MTEASDKDCNYQRTTCQTKFQWCRHTGECDRKTTQKDTQENTYEPMCRGTIICLMRRC